MARRRGDSWQGDALVNGVRKRLTFASKEQAEDFESNPYAYLNTPKSGQKIGQLFPNWSRELWGGTRNERSALRIADELLTRIGPETYIAKIDRQMVKRLVDQLRKDGNSVQTVNNKMAILSKLLKHAIDEDLLDDVPAIPFGKRPQGRIRSLSADEEQTIRSHLSAEYASLFDFLLYTGCRVSEALKLEWTDVSLDVNREACTFWRTKTDRPRTVPLASRAKQALVVWQGQGKPFATIAYDPFKKAWNRAKEKAGLGHDKQVVPHVLRHTCATRLGQGRMDPLRMQQWLGHANLNMTSRYTHLNVSDLKAGVDVLENKTR